MYVNVLLLYFDSMHSNKITKPHAIFIISKMKSILFESLYLCRSFFGGNSSLVSFKLYGERKIYRSFAKFVCLSVILESSCLFKARLSPGLLGTSWLLTAQTSSARSDFENSGGFWLFISNFGNSSISLFGFVKSPLH